MTESGNDQSALVQRAIERPLTNRLSSATADVERIIEATYAVIQRSGTMDPTMRDILKEAGLSTQRFYRYFASKDDLLLAILDDGRRLLADYIEHRLEREDRGDQKIRVWIEAMFAQASDPAASNRTRPFITNRPRLMEQHPDEMRASVHALSGPTPWSRVTVATSSIVRVKPA